MKKSIIIPIVTLLIGVGSVFGYNQATKWVQKEKVESYNAGVIRTTNQFYEQAKRGELKIRNFLLDKNSTLILENGKVKQGEMIILIPFKMVDE